MLSQGYRTPIFTSLLSNAPQDTNERRRAGYLRRSKNQTRTGPPRASSGGSSRSIDLRGSSLAAEIIGFLRRYYDSLTGSQPVFVRVDIEATSAELLRELGDEFAHRSDVGERLTHHEVVTITRASLAVIREM